MEGHLKNICDVVIVVPSNSTPRIPRGSHTHRSLGMRGGGKEPFMDSLPSSQCKGSGS